MPNLPNLSNGRTLLSSPNEYTAGESYRERIRENISNTPRKANENGAYTPRSIDLSIEKNLFRTVSRYNNPNSKSYDMDNDNNQLINQRSQKSARSRQILFYNKNHQSQDNNNNNYMNNNQPQQNFNDNQENLEQFLSPDNSSKYESEGSTNTENNYPNRRRRFEDNNFASKNNNLDNLNGTGNESVSRERVQTARGRDRENATRTPVIIPRKNVSYNNNINTNGNHNNNNHNSMNDNNMNECNSHENANRTLRNRNSDVNEFPGINSFYEETTPRLQPPKSARGNRPSNQSLSMDNTNYIPNEGSTNTPRNIRTPRTNRLPNHQSMDDYESLRSSSRANMREEGVDSPPVPMPRKRDVSTKLLPSDNNDFRIKRVSSSKISLNNTAPAAARSSYLPSAQQNLRPTRQQPEPMGTDVDPNVLERRRMDNDLNQRIIKQIENSPRIKTAIMATEEADNTAGDLFFKSRRREASSGRRQNARLDIGIDPNSILESKPRNSNKDRISFE